MLRVLSRGEPLPLQNHSFRDTPGIDVVWRGGDVLWPLNGAWFGPSEKEPDAKFPTRVLRFWCPWRILPFIRWRFGRTVGYLGFKAWGVDDERYLNWIPAEHVRRGSVALTFSARFDADDH